MKQYTIKGKLATLNDHDSANRSNKYAGAALKREMTDLVAWQLKGKERVLAPCMVKFNWYYSGRHDFDNIAFAKKYVLDGFVKAGILQNDSQKWVLGFNDTFMPVTSGEEGVLVQIEEFYEN